MAGKKQEPAVGKPSGGRWQAREAQKRAEQREAAKKRPQAPEPPRQSSEKGVLADIRQGKPLKKTTPHEREPERGELMGTLVAGLRRRRKGVIGDDEVKSKRASEERRPPPLVSSGSSRVVSKTPAGPAPAAPVIDKQQKQRQRILQELVETEKSYLATLEKLYNAREKISTILDKTALNQNEKDKVLQYIDNIGEILQANAKLQQAFEELQEIFETEPNEERIKKLESEISTLFDQSSVLHTHIVTTNREVDGILKRLGSTAPETKEKIKLINKAIGAGEANPIASIFMSPIQRFLKYPLLNKQLLVNMTENHPLYDFLNSHKKHIEHLADKMNTAEGKVAESKAAKGEVTHRQHVMREFVTSETTYLESLSKLYHKRKDVQKIILRETDLTRHDQKKVMEYIDNLGKIIEINQRLGYVFVQQQQMLDKRGVSPKEREKLEKEMNSLLEASALLHFNATKSYKEVSALLGRESNKKAAATFLTLLGGAVPIGNILSAPIQRFPRYQMLNQDLLKHTEKEHPFYSHLEARQKHIQSLAETIDRGAKPFLWYERKKMQVKELPPLPNQGLRETFMTPQLRESIALIDDIPTRDLSRQDVERFIKYTKRDFDFPKMAERLQTLTEREQNALRAAIAKVKSREHQRKDSIFTLRDKSRSRHQQNIKMLERFEQELGFALLSTSRPSSKS